ncbi:MAG: sigma factor, partial [Candidatus Poribacteria bacterium]|nr:sigma factor [Candidatus Poribacteria bacterium]
MDYINVVLKAQHGDLDAYNELVVRFQDMAFGHAHAILNDFHAAQDAAQEAFIQGFKDLHTLREPIAWPSWLRRLVFKQCDRLRRRKQLATVVLEAATDVPSPEKQPDEIL